MYTTASQLVKHLFHGKLMGDRQSMYSTIQAKHLFTKKPMGKAFIPQ
jgi:hypothetical protein